MRVCGGRKNVSRALKTLQWTLIALGLVLIGVFVASIVHRELGSRRAMREFEAAREAAMAAPTPAPTVASSPTHALPDTLPVDTELWAKGRIEGYQESLSHELGNLGIAGHRDGFFRRLKDVVVGDRLELETVTGTRSFVIDDISIVTPSDVHVLAPTEHATITLVTCYPFYYVGSAPKRYIVRATLADEPGGA
jgi:LPXTG-site transpeptidase (sortase) family protein